MRAATAGLLDTVKGELSWVLRNADGSVERSGVVDNIYTRHGRRQVPASLDLPTTVVILDDEHPAGIKQDIATFKTDLLTPAPNQTPGYAVSGNTRVFTGTFTAPSATRTIRKIGLLGSAGGTGEVSEGMARHVTAYLEISPPITQLTSQTFEYVYRLALTVSTTKSLNRWQTWTPSDEQFFATDLLNGPLTNASQGYMHACLGSEFFVDQGALYRGVCVTAGSASFKYASASSVDATLQQRIATANVLIADANNSLRVGAFGMVAAAAGAWSASVGLTSATRSYGFTPLASYEGTLSSVFKHPVGEVYYFNVVGSVALSQGDVEARGPVRADRRRTPWHYAFSVLVEDSGDTDGGTEGTYTVLKHPWHGRAEPTYDATADDSTCPASPLFAFDPVTEVALTTVKHQTVFDGRDTYWGVSYADAPNARLLRWRAHTNEQRHVDVVADTTRYYGFPAIATGTRYGVATDGDGIVWLLLRNSTLSEQRLVKIDNTKAGRWYQRPSGIVNSASPATFTVDASDEIHAMYPFVVGDVGRKIRIVNTLNNGSDSVRTVTAFNSATSVDVDGAAFVTEAGMTWHWVTVETVVTNPAAWTATLRPWLGYDAANGRMYAMSGDGLHYSLDDGATWATVTESNGLSTSLARAFREQDGGDSSRTMVIGNGGTLYWIDTNNAVNKYVPGASVHSGTHTRVTQAALPAFTGSFTKNTITSLVYDAVGCDQAGTDGVLWIGQAAGNLRGFWRMPCDTFSAGTAVAYDNSVIGGTASTDLYQSFQNGIAMPDGRVLLVSTQQQWWMASYNESTGAIVWTDLGAIFGASTHQGQIDVRPEGFVCVFGTLYSRANGGVFVGWPIKYRYDDLLTTWLPWYGSATQFNTRYGTSNGGKRDCHASWEKVLGAGQSENVEIRFVQDGAAPAVDEFVAGERFTFTTAWGVQRTNTQDLTWRSDTSFALVETKLETEAIKVAAGRGSIQVYYNRVTGSPPAAQNLGSVNLPSLDASGINYGWMPTRGDRFLSGGGSLPDAAIAGYGVVSHVHVLAGIDLGAAPPVISQIKVHFGGNAMYYLMHRYHRASADRGKLRVFYSDDNSSWTEVTAARLILNGAAAPDPGYRYIYMVSGPAGGSMANNNEQFATIDLLTAGLSAGDRTHRYWQVILGGDATTPTQGTPLFGSIWAADANGFPIGLTTAHRTDEAHDSDHGASWLFDVDFIQTRTGLSGQGGINTVDDGDADGFTDTVAIASGSFDTGSISTVTDYLAWKETPSIGNGYVRLPYGESARAHPWAAAVQARARIISASAGSIQVASDVIPDNLSAVDFEIRRPAAGTVLSAGSMPIYDKQTGYLQFHDSDFGREFRIARKAIVRMP